LPEAKKEEQIVNWPTPRQQWLLSHIFNGTGHPVEQDKTFQEIFYQIDVGKSPEPSKRKVTTELEKPCTPLPEKINELSANPAEGPDGIRPTILKSLWTSWHQYWP
jgi:hypothetical protein